MSQSSHSSVRTRNIAVALVAGTALAAGAFAFAGRSSAPPSNWSGAPAPTGSATALAPQSGAAPASAIVPVASTPADGISLSATLDRTRVLQGGDGIVRAELVLSAAEADGEQPAVPTDIIVMLDESSSMGGQKFADAQAAVDQLLSRLRPEDRFALVGYSGRAVTRIALQSATPAHVRDWKLLVAGLRPGGSTNISDALDTARSMAAHHPSDRPTRLLLISDGQPSAGDTSPTGLSTRVRQAVQADLVVGTIGVGLGFNEFLMAQLADVGTGNFHSLHGEGDMPGILAAEFDAARGTVATGVEVGLELPAGVHLVDAAGYPVQREAGRVFFRPGTLFAGQQRRIWVTLKVDATTAGERALGAVEMRFAKDGAIKTTRIDALPAIASVADQAKFVAGLDKATWEKSVVDSAFADIEKKLAEHVRDGRADDARKLLDEHAASTVALNNAVGSAAVTAHLADVKQRRAALDAAFTGANQAHKRNVFSKSNMSSSWSRSRAGSLGGRL